MEVFGLKFRVQAVRIKGFWCFSGSRSGVEDLGRQFILASKALPLS